MNLTDLIHWRLEGQPDVFTEDRDGVEWRVIHSGGRAHDAGFLQVVRFERPVKELTLSAVASYYASNGGMNLRLGIDPAGRSDPASSVIRWAPWVGAADGWTGQARTLNYYLTDLHTDVVTVYLQSKAQWPSRANTSRWREVNLWWVYGGPPAPDPDPDQGIAGQIAQMLNEVEQQLAEIKTQLDQVSVWLGQWDQGRAWIDKYNASLDLEDRGT